MPLLRLVVKKVVSIEELDRISPEWVFDLNEYLDLMEEAERQQAEKAKKKGSST